MIVGCYDLHLYCQHESLPISFVQEHEPCPPDHHRYGEFPHRFMGRSEREAKAVARNAGWKFSGGDATCPRCVRGKIKQ